MDWQLAITAIVITLAGAYLAWRGYAEWRASKGGCAGGCGCAKAEQKPAIIPVDQLTMRK
jgi:hypothetical protein